jgi:hypothetical protein
MVLPPTRGKIFAKITFRVEDYKSEELESQDEELEKKSSSKSHFHLALQIVFHIPYGNLSAVEYASCQG